MSRYKDNRTFVIQTFNTEVVSYFYLVYVKFLTNKFSENYLGTLGKCHCFYMHCVLFINNWGGKSLIRPSFASSVYIVTKVWDIYVQLVCSYWITLTSHTILNYDVCLVGFIPGMLIGRLWAFLDFMTQQRLWMPVKCLAAKRKDGLNLLSFYCASFIISTGKWLLFQEDWSKVLNFWFAKL